MSDIRADGLDVVARALTAAEQHLPDVVREATGAAAELLASRVRPKVPHRTGAAASSVRTEPGPVSAVVAAGGSRAPYFGWLDFGGRVGRKKATLRPYTSTGRYLYPGLSAADDQITAAEDKALVDVLTAAGLDVT